jgi:hypothetical protein
MTRVGAGGHCLSARWRRVAVVALVGAGLPLAPGARAGGASPYAVSGFELPIVVPGGTAVAPQPNTGASLYERAPVPNQNAFAPDADAGPSDPVQPSVIRRAGRVGESDGYSRGSSSTSAQESRMKPSLGFALHVPTE